MNNSFTSPIGTGTDLLSLFGKIKVNNEEKISENDRKHCENLQNELYQTLNQLDGWYKLFYEDIQKYKDTYRIKFLINGKLDERELCYLASRSGTNYSRHEFRSFKVLNEIVDNRQSAQKNFASHIIRYFNEQYSLSVEEPNFDNENTSITFFPNYMSYVDLVVEHLGGRSFRDTAEDELIKRFHETVHSWERHDLPDLKAKSVIFYDLFRFDSWYYDNYKRHVLKSDGERKISSLCEGLRFYALDALEANINLIHGLDPDNVDITRWYPLNTGNGMEVKFFKNGRVDVRFKDASSAQDFFRKLKLNQLR